MEGKIEIVIAFDQRDREGLREFKNQLNPLATQDLVTIWDASQILGGTDREQAITDHLNRATIILLLISADFIASEEGKKRIQQAMGRNAPPGVYVVPILLRPAYWKILGLETLTPLPSNGKAVSSWQNRQEAYLDIILDIERIIEAQKKILAGKDMKEPASEPEAGGPTSDQLVYRIEDQSWYAGDFPQTTIIDREEIAALKEKIEVLLITANPQELGAVMHLVEPYPGRKRILQAFVGPETYYLGKFGAYTAVVTKCRQGAFDMGAIMAATGYALNVWHPRAAIMVGVAFGKDPEKQQIADVLVASQIIPYERVRIGDEQIFRGAIPPSNATLLNRFENAPTWRFVRPDGVACSLHIGPILSGEKLIDDPAFKRQLFQRFPQAIGGEMEGAGLWAASGQLDVAWILVKAICDWADGRKHKQHQPLAAAAAASLVHHVLSMRTTLDSIRGGNYP